MMWVPTTWEKWEFYILCTTVINYGARGERLFLLCKTSFRRPIIIRSRQLTPTEIWLLTGGKVIRGGWVVKLAAFQRNDSNEQHQWLVDEMGLLHIVLLRVDMMGKKTFFFFYILNHGRRPSCFSRINFSCSMVVIIKVRLLLHHDDCCRSVLWLWFAWLWSKCLIVLQR